MRRFAGACRFVFNKALSLQQSNHADGGKYIGYVEMAKRLTAWRNSQETPWLKDAPAHPLQHALKDLDRAYRNFFEQRAAFPRFKRKGVRESFRYPEPKQFKLDTANARRNRALADDFQNADIACTRNMRPAAKLNGISRAFVILAMAHANDANLVAIFLTKQSHGAKFRRLLR